VRCGEVTCVTNGIGGTGLAQIKLCASIVAEDYFAPRVELRNGAVRKRRIA
jgi:hypothetical protein